MRASSAPRSTGTLLSLRHYGRIGFPRLFFPQLSPLAAALASFATFGVAFVARPVGGILFGHFGDRIGRKSMLVITLMLMGSATFLIGLVPTFNQAGYLAPVLLILLRFLQGLAVGGEWGGATLMVVEHAPEKTRYFYAAWPQTGAATGCCFPPVCLPRSHHCRTSSSSPGAGGCRSC